MDILKTSKTYKTRSNAVAKLRRACASIGCEFDRVRYVIAVNEDGRFAPVVMADSTPYAFAFPHHGVTIAN